MSGCEIKTVKKETLLENIENLRQELISMGDKNRDLLNEKTVEKSQELDNLLNMYNNLR